MRIAVEREEASSGERSVSNTACPYALWPTIVLLTVCTIGLSNPPQLLATVARVI